MESSFIDLAAPPFWLTLVAAVIVMTPMASGGIRRLAFLFINCIFLFTVLSSRQFLAIAVLLVGFHSCLALARFRRLRLPMALVSGSALLLFFLIHKLPDSPAQFKLPGGPLLAAIGFSYVFLRCIEVLRAVIEQRHPPPTLPELVNYLLPFHMLAGGPIQSYDEFRAQPSVAPVPNMADWLWGLDRIATGVFKKFVLAATIEELFLTGFRSGDWYIVLEAQLFYVWLYLDFSGYSDIACGAGRLMGVATPENFNKPFMARNLINFWERWHISLSLFIRRNIFTPVQLGLTRAIPGNHTLAIATISFLLSFGLCGLWHGISARFLIWGLLHAAGLSAVNFYRAWLHRKLGTKGVKAYNERAATKLLSTFLTFEFVAFSLLVIQFPFEGAM